MRYQKHLTGLLLLICLHITSCTVGEFKQVDDTVISTQQTSVGTSLTITFERGNQWFHTQRIAVFKVPIIPQLAVWVEDTTGNHLQTLYVTRRFAQQEWEMAKYDDTSCIRTLCMPYWFNKYKKSGHSAPTKASPLPDGVTAATPTGSFTLHTKLNQDTGTLVLLVELNKSFDNNDTYTKKRKLSAFNGQPATVYAARIDLSQPQSEFTLHPIGHSGETGDDGNLYEDMNTLTTALQMVKSVSVTCK